MKKKRSFDKARAYHRHWCSRFVRHDGIVVWRFALERGFVKYTEYWEPKWNY